MKAKEAVAGGSLTEIYQCYVKLVDEIQRAESSKYDVAQAYKSGCTFELGSDPVEQKPYLDHRFELNSDQKAIGLGQTSQSRTELYAKLLNCQATSRIVERSLACYANC